MSMLVRGCVGFGIELGKRRLRRRRLSKQSQGCSPSSSDSERVWGKNGPSAHSLRHDIGHRAPQRSRSVGKPHASATPCSRTQRCTSTHQEHSFNFFLKLVVGMYSVTCSMRKSNSDASRSLSCSVALRLRDSSAGGQCWSLRYSSICDFGEKWRSEPHTTT